jgi:hypothetical protein
MQQTQAAADRIKSADAFLMSDEVRQKMMKFLLWLRVTRSAIELRKTYDKIHQFLQNS